MDIDDFSAHLSLRAALQLYIYLAAREEELVGGPAELYASLRGYLYDRLSIEEMESPETLLSSLDMEER
jgi:hypothetical protein